MKRRNIQKLIAEYREHFTGPNKDLISKDDIDQIMNGSGDQWSRIADALHAGIMIGYAQALRYQAKQAQAKREQEKREENSGEIQINYLRDIRIKIAETSALPDEVPAAVFTWDRAEEAHERYSILLRDSLSEEEKVLGFLHECLHIYHKDFSSAVPVPEIERLRDEELLRILTVLANRPDPDYESDADILEAFRDGSYRSKPELSGNASEVC